MHRPTVSLAILLTAFWLVNSGHYTTLIMGLGAASIVLVMFISHRMDVVDHEAQPFHLTRQLPAFYAWLLKELVKSNLDVVRCIWLGNGRIDPAWARLEMNLETDMGRVIYANSVTLTPGTVAIDVDKNSLTVHALSSASIDALRNRTMEDKVRKLEQ